MKKLIVANWKELPNTWAEAEELLDFLGDQLSAEISDKADVVICPSLKYIAQVSEILQKEPLSELVELGSQDIGTDNDGDLKKLSVEYVIIGHSSRRVFESDEIINQKLKTALKNGLVPIACVGERTRDENYEEFLKEQVSATFAGLSADEIGRCFIAYEPVWAISSNPGAKPDTLQNALESISVIREALISNFQFPISNKFLYGGSVTSKNVTEFLGQKEIDGVLVGGASVNKEEFVKILSLVK